MCGTIKNRLRQCYCRDMFSCFGGLYWLSLTEVGVIQMLLECVFAGDGVGDGALITLLLSNLIVCLMISRNKSK